MYPRNAASPPRIAIGPVLQISDGAVQSSGVSVVVRAEGGSETAGGGTVSYGASSSVVYYAPTQAETNYTAFVVTAYKTGCIPASITVVTTASSTSGKVDVSHIAGTAQTARDIGASVLLSSGTGTGQISLSSGTVSLTADQAVNTTKWGGTAVASARPTVDIDTIKTQSVTCNAGVTVGAYVGGTGAAALASEVTPARMGALTDLIDDGRLDVILDTVAANVAGLGGAAMRGTDNAATAGAQMDLVNAPNATAVTAIQNGLATSTLLTTVAGYLDTEIAAILADTNELQTNQGNWVTATGFSTLDAAGVRTAVGLATANLDTQLGDIPTVTEFNARSTTDPATATAQTTAQNDLDIITGADGATLATAQGNYAPAKAGAQMDLVNAPNATAVTAIQAGLATPTNITAGTITTVTNLTNLPAVPNDWLTAAGIAADVGTEFAAAILGGEITELTSVPGASPSLKQAVALLYMALRNKRDTTSSTDTITNDAGTTIATASLSDNGTTFTKAEYL